MDPLIFQETNDLIPVIFFSGIDQYRMSCLLQHQRIRFSH